MKKWMMVLVLGATALSFQAVRAHGEAQPKHGGTVQIASDLSFELVAQPGGAAIYVEDHGQPLATAGMAGKLMVLNGSEKSEAPLVATGGNKLEAKGLRITSGSKAVAVLNTAQGKPLTVRFMVK